MRSAFTHIGGDTLRTLSVGLAAVLSSLTGTSAEVCDAWAAIVVSVSIVVIVFPLMTDIFHEARSICGETSHAVYSQVRTDEKQEEEEEGERTPFYASVVTNQSLDPRGVYDGNCDRQQQQHDLKLEALPF